MRPSGPAGSDAVADHPTLPAYKIRMSSKPGDRDDGNAPGRQRDQLAGAGSLWWRNQGGPGASTCLVAGRTRILPGFL